MRKVNLVTSEEMSPSPRGLSSDLLIFDDYPITSSVIATKHLKDFIERDGEKWVTHNSLDPQTVFTEVLGDYDGDRVGGVEQEPIPQKMTLSGNSKREILVSKSGFPYPSPRRRR